MRRADRAGAAHLATIGIVSTGPGFTLFGLVAAADGRFRRAVRHRGGKGLYRLRPADRPRLRPGAGLVALLPGAQRLGRRGRPLFRHLCAGRPRHQLHRAVPRRDGDGADRLGAGRHGDDRAVPAGRAGHSLPTPYPANKLDEALCGGLATQRDGWQRSCHERVGRPLGGRPRAQSVNAGNAACR